MFLKVYKGISMKKISVLSIIAVIIIPGLVEAAPKISDKVKVEAPGYQDLNNDFQQPKYIEIKKSNPDLRFPHGLQFGVGVSPTSGLNGFIGYNNKKFNSFWAKRFGIRFDLAAYSPIKSKINKEINDNVSSKGVDIGDDLKVNNFAINGKHFGALVDFYPFGDTWLLGGWRLSGGYFSGKLDFNSDILAKNIGGNIEFELDGKTYRYDGTVMKGKAMLDWKYSGPYLGTGFDLGIVYGFKIFMDLGVVFTDKNANLGLNVPLDGLTDPDTGYQIEDGTGNPTIQAVYDEFVARRDKVLSDGQKKLDKYDYFPLLKIGFMYRF